MRILIDMQGIQTPFSSRRGVGIYIENIVRELAAIAGGHDIGYLFNAEFPDQYFECLDRLQGIVTPQNSHLFVQKIFDNYRFASEQQLRVAERFFSAFIETLAPDVLFSPNLQEGMDDKAVTAFAAAGGSFAQIATLHDMVPMFMEDDYLGDDRTRRWYERKIADAKRCDRIVTVSNSSKRDIERFLDVDACRVEAIPNGYDPARFNTSADQGERERVQQLIGIQGGYVLHYGGADKHKNLPRLIEAYARLPLALRATCPLVLGGNDAATSSEVLQAIAENRLDGQVFFLGFIPSSLLPAVIRGASLFVFPSTYEGFGLPALEAMACGTPTVGSESSGIGEVLGNPDATFDPFDVEDIASRIGNVLESEALRASLREHGLQRAANYSWFKAATRLLEVMEEEDGRRRERSRLSVIARRVAEEISDDDPVLAEAAALTIAQSIPAERPRRLYIDVSSVALYGGHSGIQRVARQLARLLPLTSAVHDVEAQVVYAVEGTNVLRALSSINQDGSLTPDPAGDRPVDLAAADILLFLDLHPGLAIRMEHDVQRMRALGVKVYHVVYDILPVLMPEKFWPELQEEFYRWLQVVSRSDGLLCISRTVAEQTAAYLEKFGVPRSGPLLVGNFPLGADFAAAPSEAHETGEFDELFGNGLRFLMVGTLEPRKAHEQTLLAFEEGWRSGQSWRLIIVGKQGWKMERLAEYIRRHPEFGRRLFWFERASDDALRELYTAADCIICPSEGEGFGLPLIEAALAQKPVIARDIPVFREVAGAGAFYFHDDRDPTTIASAVQAWALSDRMSQHCRREQIRPHSWSDAADAVSAALCGEMQWPFEVHSAGALDLRNPVTLANANLRLGGFHKQESSFVWTSRTATIEFETLEAFEAVDIELECSSWRDMPFDVLLNGESVCSATAATSSTKHRFSVGPLPAGMNRIELHSRGAGAPRQDARTLGLAVRQLRMFGRMPVKLGQWVNARDLRVQWNGFSPPQESGRSVEQSPSSLEFYLAEGHPSGILSIYGKAAHPTGATFTINGVTRSRQPLMQGSWTLELAAGPLREGKNVIEINVDAGRSSPEQGVTILEFRVAAEKDAWISSTNIEVVAASSDDQPE